MKNRRLNTLFVLLSALLFTIISISQAYAQTLPREKYIFFNIFTTISGTSDNGYMLIDFPTYNFNTAARTLNAMISIDLTDQTQIIYGSGIGLSGNVGGGASTGLTCYEDLTVPDLFVADTNGTVQYNHQGTWITLVPGQEINETIETNAYRGFTGELIVTHRIRNLGIWDKGDITSPELTPVPTGDSTPGPEITPQQIRLGDVSEDGTINIVDALLVAQYYVKLDPMVFNPGVADVNCDGTITIVDALLIAQYYVELITEFCS